MIQSSLDWQRSHDPAAMWAVVKDRATELLGGGVVLAGQGGDG